MASSEYQDNTEATRNIMHASYSWDGGSGITWTAPTFKLRDALLGLYYSHVLQMGIYFQLILKIKYFI